MSNYVLLFNVASMVLSNPISDFDIFKKNLPRDEVLLLEENNIETPDDLYNFMTKNNAYVYTDKGQNVSQAITNINSHLQNNYSEYTWYKDEENSNTTFDVSNAIPIEMKSDDFPMNDIEAALTFCGLTHLTSYGGCGPIASLGILDYFARYLNYNEIMEHPSSMDERIKLAINFFNNTMFSIFSNDEGTLVWPWSLRNAVNRTLDDLQLGDKINCYAVYTLFGGRKEEYWNIIISNINKGLPVTFGTGFGCEGGSFSQHYTNIYGYETWIGIPKDDGTFLTKTFLKARINQDSSYEEIYCDADILDCSQLALLTYAPSYSNVYDFQAKDFSKNFLNSSGGGQYFFTPISDSINLSSGYSIDTNRLRTSYIENQYLVMSPKRKDAGTAYLEITFPHEIEGITFESSLWSPSEGHEFQDFYIEYKEIDEWTRHKEINLYSLSKDKNNLDSFTFRFPKGIKSIRFFTVNDLPNGDRNKGRIVLDNFHVFGDE